MPTFFWITKRAHHYTTSGKAAVYAKVCTCNGTYEVAEAYEVYSAIIPIINPNPETHTWFIRIDTLPMGRGSLPPADPSNPAREETYRLPEGRAALGC